VVDNDDANIAMEFKADEIGHGSLQHFTAVNARAGVSAIRSPQIMPHPSNRRVEKRSAFHQ
jgi:hypothetical protein